MSARVVVILVGPQAAGKSTIAAALADSMRDAGERVALVELDQIAAMALPTLPSWEDAHRIFADVVAAWSRTGLSCVVAEGSGSSHEVAELVRQVPGGAVSVTVAVSASFDTAYTRARSDPTRGVSRDETFLRTAYEGWAEELTKLRADLIVDTTVSSVDDAVRDIRAAVVRARVSAAARASRGR